MNGFWINDPKTISGLSLKKAKFSWLFWFIHLEKIGNFATVMQKNFSENFSRNLQIIRLYRIARWVYECWSTSICKLVIGTQRCRVGEYISESGRQRLLASLRLPNPSVAISLLLTVNYILSLFDGMRNNRLTKSNLKIKWMDHGW